MEMQHVAEACNAIIFGDADLLKEYIEKHQELVDFKLPDSEYSLLHVAAKSNQVECAKLLIEAGSSLSYYPSHSYIPKQKGAGSGSWTPLVQALNEESHEVANLIASYDVTPNNLWVAVGLGDLESVKSFFAEDGSLKENAGDPGKLLSNQEILDDAFCMACHMGRIEFIDFLLDKGANVSGRDHWGMTGLHWTIECHPELSNYLIDKGADVRIRDAQHVATPLMWALYFNQGELADYMLENCSIHICDAVILGRADLVEKLIADDPDLVHGPLGLEEPIRVAAHKGNEKLVRYLLEKGASALNYETRPGMFDPNEVKNTALGWAEQEGHLKIVEILKEAGAER